MRLAAPPTRREAISFASLVLLSAVPTLPVFALDGGVTADAARVQSEAMGVEAAGGLKAGTGRPLNALIKMRAETGVERTGAVETPLFKPGQCFDELRTVRGAAEVAFSFPEAWTMATGPNLDVRAQALTQALILTLSQAPTRTRTRCVTSRRATRPLCWRHRCPTSARSSRSRMRGSWRCLLAPPLTQAEVPLSPTPDPGPNPNPNASSNPNPNRNQVIFNPLGKYGSYGAVEERKVVSSKLIPLRLPSGGEQAYRRMSLKFAPLTYNMNTVERRALVSATAVGGTVFILVSGSLATRFKAMQPELVAVQDSFRVLAVGGRRIVNGG